METSKCPTSAIFNALSELVRAGESPNLYEIDNVRRDVVCREVIKIRDACKDLRAELARLKSDKEAAERERDELCELFDCQPADLKREVVESRELWDGLLRVSQEKLTAATSRAEALEKGIRRLMHDRSGVPVHFIRQYDKSGVRIADFYHDDLAALPPAKEVEGG